MPVRQVLPSRLRRSLAILSWGHLIGAEPSDGLLTGSVGHPIDCLRYQARGFVDRGDGRSQPTPGATAAGLTDTYPNAGQPLLMP
jgi:hypothetical protein